MIQSGGFLIPDPLGLFGSFLPFNMINSVANSYRKELKNIDPRELNTNLLADTGLKIFVKKKKLKKEFL